MTAPPLTCFVVCLILILEREKMKLKGKVLSERGVVTIEIVRGEEIIEFKAAAVLSYDEFDKLYPPPVPPRRTHADGRVEELLDAPEYIEAITKRNKIKVKWQVWKSLQATPDLVWETVDPKKPETFVNVETELAQAGFTPYETNQIMTGVAEANGFCSDEKLAQLRARRRMQAARENFTPSGSADNQSTTPTDVPANTSSGASANDGAKTQTPAGSKA